MAFTNCTYTSCTSDPCTNTSCTGDPWPTWCNAATTTGTMTSVWIGWMGNISTTSQSSTTNQVWTAWIIFQLQAMHNLQSMTPTAYVPPTPEAIAARDAKIKEIQEARKAADRKAMELLRENLTKKQRASLERRKWFLVQGGKSSKTYRIESHTHAGNIYELDEKGKAVARYCVHAEYQIPLGDQLLAQAMSIRLDEEHLISKANKTALLAA